MSTHACRAHLIAFLLFSASLASAAETASITKAPSPAASNPWNTSASLAFKESFDNNVFLQSVTSNANHQSFVSTLIPAVGVAFKPSALFDASLNYAPEINFFHSASSEDFTLHRAVAALKGKAGTTAWDLTESFIAIDGSDLGPSYFGRGGAPAGGGPQIRDRRDALIERGQFRLTETLGNWFLRPVVSGYLHDFRTIQKTTAGYQNFVDRNDLNGGLDLGFGVANQTWLTAGYRYGVQNQAKLFSFPEQYDSAYHRLLVGLEGAPFPWLKLSLSAGPEFRQYADTVPATFDRSQLYAYADCSATLTPGKADTLTLTVKSFEQPGFAGRSTYIDSTYDATWRHKVGDKLVLGLGLRAYNTDFIKPVLRNDWIITPSAVASYSFNPRLNAEVSYLFDDAESLISNTPGREYTHHLVALGLRYIFK
jgi:hypothetical protein